MTPAETAKVLAKASAYDQRTVGQTDVLAWHEALRDLGYDDAMAAVAKHYAHSTDRIMPAHIRRLVVAARNARYRPLEDEILPAIEGRVNEIDWQESRERGLASVREVLATIKLKRRGAA